MSLHSDIAETSIAHPSVYFQKIGLRGHKVMEFNKLEGSNIL